MKVKINKACKYRLIPTKEQEIMFRKTFGCVRNVHNLMLGDKIEHYNEHKEMLKNTPAQYKDDYPYLKEVDSLALANAGQNIHRAYLNFFSRRAEFPTFKKKKHAQSYTTNNQNGTVAIEGGKIKLPKIGHVKVIIDRHIPVDAKIKTATISQTSSGKFFVSVMYEIEIDIVEIPIENDEQILGLDFSMGKFYISSDGEVGAYPKFYRQYEEKLKREQRKLSKMEKSSNNYEKQRIKVALIHEKITNCRKDFLHKRSRSITDDYDVVVIESLNMKGMSKALNFGKSVMDNGWGMFISQLKYKLEELGKQLIVADKWFASSKLCNNCNFKKEELSLSERTYHCDNCGVEIDRDYNAALNLRDYGKQIIGLV